MWDERFNTIEYQECDYFTRALIFNKDKSSINDFRHHRLLNQILNDNQDHSIVVRENNNTDLDKRIPDLYSLKLVNYKYSKSPINNWDNVFISEPPKLINKQNLFYPYFEKDIPNISNNYFIP